MNNENFNIAGATNNRPQAEPPSFFSSKGFQILLTLGVNVLIYSMTYFYPAIALYSSDYSDNYADREIRRYVLYALAAIGFYLCYNVIELYKQSRGESIEDGTAGIDAEFMGTYNHTTLQDKKWFAYVFSAAAGAINVLLYLAFLGFVVK